MSAMLPHLLLPLPVWATLRSPSRVTLSKKLIGGSETMRRFWPGNFTMVLQPSMVLEGHPDAIDVNPAELDFDLRVLPFDSGEFLELLASVDVVNFLPTTRTQIVVDTCARLGIPGVLITENTVRTRLQMARATIPNHARYLRRSVSVLAEEAVIRKNIRAMAGLQTNGTPTYEAYRALNPRTMMYFDSRVTEDLLVTEDALAARVQRLSEPGPLRLVFSGRLTDIKGTDDLPEVASRLKQRGVDFTLDIYGSGDQEWVVQRKIDRYDLKDRVRIHGSLDFRTELMPKVAQEADLFVCCHRQGDPSCTYLETFACGVPVIGYRNEALRGLLDRVPAGEVTPMNQPKRLGDALADLAENPAQIREMSFAARSFAQEHTFSETFKARMDHLLRVYEDTRAAR